MNQIKIDFSQPKIQLDDEKKTELIAFRIGSNFKHDLETVCKAKGFDMSKLCQEYVIKGFLDDYKNMLLNSLNGKATLNELLR
jgi:hypothetical protein